MKSLICAVTVLAVSTAQADTIYVDANCPGGDGLAAPHRMMHAETRVLPAPHLRDERPVDLAALQEKLEDLPLLFSKQIS